MFDLDRWQEIIAVLRKNKLRTALTAFGVLWGILMLVLMLGAGTGLENGIKSNFGGTATNSFFVWAQRTSKPYMGLPPNRSFRYTNEDAIAIKKIPELDVVCPRNQIGGYRSANQVIRGKKSGAFNVMGDYPDVLKIEPKPIVQGRFINDLDIDNQRKVIVIGEYVKDILFEEDENPIGEFVGINGIYFKVIGVFGTHRSGERARDETKSLHIPFTTFQKSFNYGNTVGFFAITSKPNIPASEAEELVIALLKERHKISPDDQMAVGHFNLEKEYNKFMGLFDGINILVWFVGIFTIIAGAIGVSNIMLIVVKERTKEIGIRRAIGARPATIISQIMLESIFLTTIAGYTGLVIGVLIWQAVEGAIGEGNGTFANPQVDFNVAMIALGVLVVTGAIAGLMPANRAVSISTVDALRTE
ncbi:MAG: ABC transporter permease [Bacteroidia bacterium]|nr:ABC transporter permease [Bacteroidia bacterium]